MANPFDQIIIQACKLKKIKYIYEKNKISFFFNNSNSVFIYELSEFIV